MSDFQSRAEWGREPKNLPLSASVYCLLTLASGMALPCCLSLDARVPAFNALWAIAAKELFGLLIRNTFFESKVCVMSHQMPRVIS